MAILWHNVSITSEKTLIIEMKYVDFKVLMGDQIIWGHRDIRLLDSNFDLNILSDWQKKNYIRKVRRGLYVFSNLELDDHLKYHISNELYQPSYISFEQALSIYGLIPETVYAVTAATSRRTITFDTVLGSFIYRHLKPELMFGYRVDVFNKVKSKIARIEKAVLDYFYIYSDLQSTQDFDDVRFDYQYFLEQADRNLLDQYLEKFKNKALEQRINNLIRSAENA